MVLARIGYNQIKDHMQYPTEPDTTIVVTHVGKDKQWPMLRGFLLERDVAIGTIPRPSRTKNFIPSITCKFFSDAARNRFDNFSDSLSIEETLEAILVLPKCRT